MKYFALNSASRTFICFLTVGNHSDIRKYRFHAKYVVKTFRWNTFLISECILKLQQIKDTFYGRERNSLKTPEQVTLLVYVHAILFRMHDRDTATELEFRSVLPMTLEHVLT